jgi:hypothetical protein
MLLNWAEIAPGNFGGLYPNLAEIAPGNFGGHHLRRPQAKGVTFARYAA